MRRQAGSEHVNQLTSDQKVGGSNPSRHDILKNRFFVLTTEFDSVLYGHVHGETNDKKRADFDADRIQRRCGRYIFNQLDSGFSCHVTHAALVSRYDLRRSQPESDSVRRIRWNQASKRYLDFRRGHLDEGKGFHRAAGSLRCADRVRSRNAKGDIVRRLQRQTIFRGHVAVGWQHFEMDTVYAGSFSPSGHWPDAIYRSKWTRR